MYGFLLGVTTSVFLLNLCMYFGLNPSTSSDRLVMSFIAMAMAGINFLVIRR